MVSSYLAQKCLSVMEFQPIIQNVVRVRKVLSKSGADWI